MGWRQAKLPQPVVEMGAITSEGRVALHQASDYDPCRIDDGDPQNQEHCGCFGAAEDGQGAQGKAQERETKEGETYCQTSTRSTSETKTKETRFER